MLSFTHLHPTAVTPHLYKHTILSSSAVTLPSILSYRSLASKSKSSSSSSSSSKDDKGNKQRQQQQKLKDVTSGEKQGVNLGKDGTTTDTSKKPDVRHPHDQQEGEKELRNPGKSPLDQHEPGQIDPNIQRKPFSTYTRVNNIYHNTQQQNNKKYHTISSFNRILNYPIYHNNTTTVHQTQHNRSFTAKATAPAIKPSENTPHSSDGFVGYTEDGRRLTTEKPSAKNPLNKSGYAQSASRERFRQEEQDRNTYGDELENVYERTRTRPPTETNPHH